MIVLLVMVDGGGVGGCVLFFISYVFQKFSLF